MSALPRGQYFTRDSHAMSRGLQVAPHQSLIAYVLSATVLRNGLDALRSAAQEAASHLTRIESRSAKASLIGTNVFLGHGRSPVWRELKDFIENRLHLPVDEFNSVPVAGVTTTSRLSELLDAAAFAFLIMTAEDEQIDGKVRARENVVHEVGLFQGRLGFTKAIVLLEEGCEEFSNIHGLGQIRFPKGCIGAKFEDIRAVLEREGLIDN
jgi:predicted nucleotide-binding protein